MRIARELHDVMAHHIAVINVHAGLARRAIGRDAGTVDTSLRHVQEAARTVLDELGTVLSVLRTTDDRESASEPTTEPVPGLERLDELLETFAAAGFEVRTRATGRMRDMDRACDLAAFRIIQESLANASKHGADGQAELTLVYAASGLTIGVSNLVRLDPPGFSSIIPAPVGHGRWPLTRVRGFAHRRRRQGCLGRARGPPVPAYDKPNPVAACHRIPGVARIHRRPWPRGAAVLRGRQPPISLSPIRPAPGGEYAPPFEGIRSHPRNVSSLTSDLRELTGEFE